MSGFTVPMSGFSDSLNVADMQCPVMKRMFFIQQKISQEQLQKLRGLMDAVFYVVIVCPDKGIAEIPCLLSKDIVCYIKTEGAQTLDEENCR